MSFSFFLCAAILTAEPPVHRRFSFSSPPFPPFSARHAAARPGNVEPEEGDELKELLGPLGFELKTLADLPNAVSVEETGDTFAANAALKASSRPSI